MFGKEKMKVEIIAGNRVKKKKCEVEGKTVIIEKGSKGRGRATHKAEFDSSCILFDKTFFGNFKQRLIMMENADKCVSFNGEEEEVKVPVFDRETSNRHIRANVIKNAGATTQKITIPMTMYLLLGVVMVVGILNLLFSTGRLRIV